MHGIWYMKRFPYTSTAVIASQGFKISAHKLQDHFNGGAGFEILTLLC